MGNVLVSDASPEPSVDSVNSFCTILSGSSPVCMARYSYSHVGYMYMCTCMCIIVYYYYSHYGDHCTYM